MSANLFFSCVKQTDLANVEARLWGVGSKSYILCFCFRLRDLPKLCSLSQKSPLNNTLSRKYFLVEVIFSNVLVFFQRSIFSRYSSAKELLLVTR